MNDHDLRPLLVCRLECPEHMAADVDAWMPKHFDDALDEPPVVAATGYRVLQDFTPATGLPWIFNGHGNRFVAYATDSVQGLFDWLSGEMAKQSIDDGADRESQYPLLDAEPFTGNIYEGLAVINPVGSEFLGEASILVERFDVGPSEEREFTAWLESTYTPRWAEHPGVRRVRVFRQVRGVPQVFPYTRYMSKGNVMIISDLSTDLRPIDLVHSAQPLLAESVQWDIRLPYVRREVADCFVLRTKGDARATYAARRSSDGSS
jgi:hypothetical protein